jgi:hypothetical protein
VKIVVGSAKTLAGTLSSMVAAVFLPWPTRKVIINNRP